MTWQDAGIVFTFLLGIWNLYAHLRDNKRTTFINTVTSERVRWIQSTKDAISTLCGRTHYWVMTQDELSQEDSNSVRKEIDRLRTLVKLQLNPKEELSQRLIKLVDQMPSHTHKTQANEMEQLLADIVTTSQLLLKDEWDKVRAEAVHGDLRQKSILAKFCANQPMERTR